MERRTEDRRFAYGSELLAALWRSKQPLSFSELVGSVGSGDFRISEVVAWLRQAELTGLVAVAPALREAEKPPASRRITLTSAGEAIAFGGADRRRSQDRRAVA